MSVVEMYHENQYFFGGWGWGVCVELIPICGTLDKRAPKGNYHHPRLDRYSPTSLKLR